VTGKGGVGKTTVSYALGLASAASGQRTIVCEVAEQERGSRLFDLEPIGFEETELADDLWAISIDPHRMVREYLEVLLPVRAMARLLHRSNLFAYLAAATPGLQEVVTIGKAWELSQDERRAPGVDRTYDRVIVDSPATGHGLAFLESPGTFKRIAGAGPLAHQAGRIEATITDPDVTAVAVVSTPEEMAITEVGIVAEGLTEIGVELGLVIANGVYPDRFSDRELDLLRSAGNEPGGAVAAAVSEAERARTQRWELERVDSLAPGVPTVELPYLFRERIGRQELDLLAGVLG
jgi:anion-transporting  ArsA/GET3 family ATPase